jgi:hypothetical protein
MIKFNLKKLMTIGAVFSAIAFGVFGTILTAPTVQAETSLPSDPSPPPMPPSPYECMNILNTPVAPTAQGTQIAEFWHCWQTYNVAWSTYEIAARDYWTRRHTQISQDIQFKIKIAAMGALLDGLAYMTTNFAYDTANAILGVESPEGRPAFWEDDFGTWLKYHGDKASGVFFERFDALAELSADFGSGEQTRFGFTTLCKKPSPLDLRLALGMQDAMPLDFDGCTITKMLDNFEAISDMVSSGEALSMHREPFMPSNNDLHIGVEIHSNYIDAILSEKERAKLSRIESEGMRPVIDKITQRIQWPSMVANESIRNVDPILMAQKGNDKQQDYMVTAFWNTGLEGLGILTLSTFLNRLVFGFLDKILNPESSMGGVALDGLTRYSISFYELSNVDATGEMHNYYERQAFAKSLGDFIIPSYFTQENKDLITELSACPPVRGRWHCAMDQSLAMAIKLGAREGALTIGKAAGVGSEAAKFTPNAQGLNPNWELIPETDIVNNTDPSCYQRAYCAGNLKKLRLARILPIGFEMAANSPYNTKRDGKYVTLGTVINGFYDCNDEGKLDKDHPWCHLIDPNWILAAPRYQCRTKGYGDTLMPEVGTRQEECGDMVTCLGTNQKGECDKGYGYCLAERPVYKFSAPECSEQYASCRTYTSSQGQSLSALRYTVERGACSEESIGCMWFALDRYVTSTASPDGLWVGNLTKGPRVYLDGGAEPCSAEGCVKVLQVQPGQSAFNLINNSSFEQTIQDDSGIEFITQGFTGWSLDVGQCMNAPNLQDVNTQAYFGGNSLRLHVNQTCDRPSSASQEIHLEPNRNYTLSMYVRWDDANVDNGASFNIVSRVNDNEMPSVIPAVFEQCGLNSAGTEVVFNKEKVSNVWTRQVCQFVSPNQEDLVMTLRLATAGHDLYFDAILLEEGEYINSYIESVAGLDESYIKIAPDEYSCTGNDELDHPSCKNFARVCRETEVGCQGYTDVEDPSAPEIPAILSPRDYCPGICAGYGEYRKLASAFDLVRDPIYPQFNDPDDAGTAYIIPNQALSCSVQNIGCEPFTNMSPAAEGGEQVSYFNALRTCELPNELSRTYFTWEGSDLTGYELRTWALISTSPTDTSPKIVLKGAQYGDIKEPNSCTEDLWKSGADPDCRQFYDEQGQVYYSYYSQTVSSNSACTLFRKDDATAVDCQMTGGHEYVAQSASCLYYALPSESSSCPATAGGCRAYMGPTGRNAVQVYFESFMSDSSLDGFVSTAGSVISRSEESVLVGDYSLKIDSSAGSAVQVERSVEINTTSTLYRISFWSKALSSDPVNVIVDGQTVGTYSPSMIWQRYEFGPFQPESGTPVISFSAPASIGTLFIDTIKMDQLNDVRFLVKNSWTIPATCDTTPENTPEPRAMLGCREYSDRDGNQIFARRFSSLCRADSIGCKAFIDTRGMPRPYSETRTITGTQTPSQRVDLDARTYENQYIGNWSVTSPAWRYYYAIDDFRARCDESQNSCRAFGKPVFTQNRLALESTEFGVDPADTVLLQTQNVIYEFQTVLLKHNWDAYYKSDTSLNLACRKDELHCDRFQSGNVTEYFRNPGNHSCEWRDSIELTADPSIGIYTNGSYGGWFRVGTSIPCYPGDDSQSPPKAPYLKGGDTFGAYFTGEDPYSGWVGHCPVNQSECTEFIDPNDTSDPTRPFGRSYFLINSRQLDTRSCGGQADPLSGCVLFNNKSLGTLQANSKATYQKTVDERGAAQTPVDCDNDSENPYCKVCVNFVLKNLPSGSNPTTPGELLSALQLNAVNTLTYAKQLIDYELKLEKSGFACESDLDCAYEGQAIFAEGATPANFSGFAVGSCGRKNDSNVVIKVQLDRECARWMGCRTGETVYDPAQQKFVNQCSELELCEKAGSQSEDIFCSRFTNREAEDFLSQGQFINLENYSARRISYGAMDYSGYAIPNQYLMPDIKVRSVGAEIMPTAVLREKYKLDNRLVAEVSLNNPNIVEVDDPAAGSSKVCRDHVLISAQSEEYQSFIIANTGQICTNDDDCSEYLNVPGGYNVQGKCGLSLCQDTRTGRMGYIDGIKNVCVLAINEPQAISSAVITTAKDLSRDIANVYNYYTDDNISTRNTALQSFMPAPECQLYPEVGSPLPNEYVETWNMSSKPPTPAKMVTGYESARACVYGEDCSCSYRKVRYGTGADQYYSIYGQAPAIGICVGGNTPGKACVPGGYVPTNAKNELLVSMQVNNTALSQQACDGGMCQAIQDVVVLNGRYAYCLERDKSRAGGSNQLSAPCLTWSPQNVIGGQYDVTHYSPTAGYLPPQGSGEYFCASGANEQTLKTPQAESHLYWKDPVLGSWTGPDFWNPGNLRQLGYSRTDVWYYNKGTYNNTAIDGATNRYSPSTPMLDCIKHDEKSKGAESTALRCDTSDLGNVMKAGATQNLRFACRRASVCEGVEVAKHDVEERVDDNRYEGRWIMTGDAISNSYMEYFVPAGPGVWGIDEKYFDYHYGLFKFSLVPDALGSACKWNPKWVGMSHISMPAMEGADFSCSGYLQQIQNNSQQFYSQFTGRFPGILDRTSETVFQDAQGAPLKMACTLGSGSCYYKFWETGYQDKSKPKFIWPETTYKQKLEQFDFKKQFNQYYAQECRSSEPYFSIRAVFQNANSYTNSLPPEETLENGLEGPWQFVGFWFTTCLNADNRMNDPGWLYMRLDTISSDVCREVAQVKDNNGQSTAFMDRIWPLSSFLLPSLGLRYDTPNSPFGSALATGKIGTEPMLVGASVPLSGDLQKAPTFIDSGVTVASLFNQQNSWVPLSNLFAKIYKIWRWDPIPVYSWDSACVLGSQKGKICSKDAPRIQGLKECGDYAECNPDIDTGLKNQNWRCNTLSGVNRGLSCGQDFTNPARNVDPVCHNAAMQMIPNPSDPADPFYEPVLSSCVADPQNLASFTIPLADFGSCWIRTTNNYGSVNNFDCRSDLSINVSGGAPPDAVMEFRMIKCSNTDSYFALPIKPNYNYRTANTSSGLNYWDFHFHIWGLAYEVMMESIAKAGISYDQNSNRWTCPLNNTAVANSDLLQTYFDKYPEIRTPAPSQPNIYPVMDGFTYSGTDLDGLVDLDLKQAMPRQFNLGMWDADRGNGLIVKKCDNSSVNAGARCEIADSKSGECPTEIAVCGSARYTEIRNAFSEAHKFAQCGSALYCPNYVPPKADEYPPCSSCITSDPNDQYKELYEGTGYCQNFNSLSRCTKNYDCVFTSFEFWGAEDLGGAVGRRFDDESVRFIAYSREDLLINPTAVQKDLRLPTPLFVDNFQVKTQVPEVYSQPAEIKRVGRWPDGGNPICDDLYWHTLCSSHLDDTPILWLHVEANEAYKNCQWSCAYAHQLFPNSYAKNFDEIVKSSSGQKLRTAAVAPFAVNPQIRNQLSRGHAAVDWNGSKRVMMRKISYYVMGVAGGSNPFGYFDGKLPYHYDLSQLLSLLISLYGNTGGVTAMQQYTDRANVVFNGVIAPQDSVAYYSDNGNFVKRLNDGFPWLADKLYFTTIFPLATDRQSSYSEPEYYEVHKDTRVYDLYWEGYGMSRKLFEIAKKYLKDVAVEHPGKGEFDYERQAAKDMEEEFFNKTGWGTFLTPNDPRLQLYPGAIPAAVPREANRERYTVYVPGHCEPPLGGTDTDTVQGKPANLITANQKGNKKFAGLLVPDVWNDGAGNDTTGPDLIDPDQGYKFGNFLMPWQPKAEVENLFLDENRDYYPPYGMDEANDFGTIYPDKYTWAQPYVAVDRSVEPTSIAISCDNCPVVQTYRTSCRCEGGRLNGTVQESKLDCNLYLPNALNPDKYTDPNDPAIPILCKPVSDATGQPIPECQAAFGIPGHQDPDMDNNSCTHKAGYVPRGDVCGDGRENCLVTYELNEPVSTNHMSKPKNQLAAPSATAVAGGLDTYFFLTGGKTNKDNRNYVSWYRPIPPKVAAPDASRSGAAASSLPVAAMDTFSINGIPLGLTYFGSGQGLAKIQFYAWAAHNQGPIKSIIIDWGDGHVQEINHAQLKNRKPICNTGRECEFAPGLACSADSDCPPGVGACLQTGSCQKQTYRDCFKDDDCGANDKCVPRTFFGNSTEACQQGYFEFVHIYKCDDSNVRNISTACDAGNRCENEPDVVCSSNAQCRVGESCVSGLAPRGGCYNESLYRCRYTPRIMVKDNWGWCTGDCTQTNESQPNSTFGDYNIRHPNGGCLDASDTKLNTVVANNTDASTLPNECRAEIVNPLYRPWIIYQGSVEVSYESAIGGLIKSFSAGGLQSNLNNNLFQILQGSQLNSTIITPPNLLIKPINPIITP